MEQDKVVAVGSEQGHSRRGALRLLGGALLASVLGGAVSRESSARQKRPVPPQDEFEVMCGNIRSKYAEMKRQADAERDKGLRELLLEQLKKVDLEWRIKGCQGRYGNVATVAKPPSPRPPYSGSGAVAGGGQQATRRQQVTRVGQQASSVDTSGRARYQRSKKHRHQR